MDVLVSKLVDTEKRNSAQTERIQRRRGLQEREKMDTATVTRSAANKGDGYRDDDGAGRENDETQYLDA